MAPEQSDLSTVRLQLQQFFDEWHFRVLHSAVANDMDRNKAIDIALSMFELHNGFQIPESERQVLMELDEPTMVERLLNMMTPQAMETFEHFALQLQLIVSSTTRVRRALEDHDNDAVEASMEASDSTGITQQILKQAVVAAGIEVAELKGRYDSWAKNTENRVGRLARSADDAQRAQTQLLAVQAQLDSFGGTQNAKAKKVLMGVAGGQDKALKASVFGSWNGWVQKVKGEKDIRDKFEQQIANAENKLIEYKQKQMSNVTGVLNRKAAESEGGLKGFVFAAWIQDIADRKKEAEMQAEMAAVQGKLQSYKSAQAENTKKVMTRMSAGSDANLVNLCWQAWLTFLQDYKKDKEMEDKVKAAEKQVQDFLKKKSDEAKGVLDRMSGASDSGLLSNVVKAWVGLIKEEKEAREMEEMMAGGNSKFSSLNQQRGAAAKGVMGRVSHMQEFLFMMKFFGAWAADAKTETILASYGTKIEHKKDQLQKVQQMFRQFATQLEQGLSPRTGKSGGPSTKQFKDSLGAGAGASDA